MVFTGEERKERLKRRDAMLAILNFAFDKATISSAVRVQNCGKKLSRLHSAHRSARTNRPIGS
jgi:hypothetical protein